jgi:hypothetical protein
MWASQFGAMKVRGCWESEETNLPVILALPRIFHHVPPLRCFLNSAPREAISAFSLWQGRWGRGVAFRCWARACPTQPGLRDGCHPAWRSRWPRMKPGLPGLSSPASEASPSPVTYFFSTLTPSFGWLHNSLLRSPLRPWSLCPPAFSSTLARMMPPLATSSR